MAGAGGFFKSILLFLAIGSLLFMVGLFAFTYYLMEPTQAPQAPDVTQAPDDRTEKEKQKKITKELELAKRKIAELTDTNQILKQTTNRFEEEKGVILEQVRDSVSGFADYKDEVSAEIAGLNESIAALEAGKSELNNMMQMKAQEAETHTRLLMSQIHELNLIIDSSKSETAQLRDLMNKTSKKTIVIEAAKLHYNIGNFYYRQQEFQTAADEYRKSLMYAPLDADAHFNLALVCDEHLGQIKEAILHYKRYLALSPDTENYLKIENRILDLEMQELAVSGNSLVTS